MSGNIIDCGNGFWNIRGHFRLGGLLDIGTQASLVRLGDGSFTLLDSYDFTPETWAGIDRITGGRAAITRVIYTHPFHTLHTEAMHAALPGARHHPTARHRRSFAHLTWDETDSEDPVLAAALVPELEITRPAGVTFIPRNENVHCASLLVFHPASGSIHVDDTFNYRLLKLGRRGRLSVHPTLSMALEQRPGAAADFRAWGAGIVARWAVAQRICTAHNGVLGPEHLVAGQSVAGAMADALTRVESKLARHEKRWG